MRGPAGLANNGGPTQTFALEAGSPTTNAGDGSVCAAPPVNNLDQRGLVRPGAGPTNCPIGAYEFNSPGPLAACVGDCNQNSAVTIDELITTVNIALGRASFFLFPLKVSRTAMTTVPRSHLQPSPYA
jgi:hypothetical protein